MVTSFTRFVVAFSFLRSGLGLQSTPANIFLISLSLFMTFFVMGPTFDRAWNDGVRPLTENQISEAEAFTRTTEPFREFMLTHVRPKDLQMFSDLAAVNYPRPSEGEKYDRSTSARASLIEMITPSVRSAVRSGWVPASTWRIAFSSPGSAMRAAANA